MKIIHKKYCSHCHKRAIGNLVKSVISKIRYGRRIQYYRCNLCNTARVNKYRHTPQGSANARKTVYKSIKKYKAKQDARLILHTAVRKGEIIKPKRCTHCGKKCAVHGHHTDYKKPLAVLWVCRQCHAAIHRKMKAKCGKINRSNKDNKRSRQPTPASRFLARSAGVLV